MNWRRILWISGLVAIMLLLVIWVYPDRDDFSSTNASWNGTDAFRARFQATTLNSLADLPVQPSGTTLVLVPYIPSSTEELQQLKDYVLGGGTLLIMDDYGFGNEVLGHLGLSWKFSGQPLLDPLINYRNEQFPKIMDFSDSPLAQDVDAIVFNHATSLTDVPDDQVIASSSSLSFVDNDDNFSYDEEADETGPFVVAASTELGQGQVIAIADPSIAINGMIGMEDNETFLTNSTAARTPQPQVLLDQSHLTESALTMTQEGLGIARDAFSYPPIIFAAVGIMLFLTWRPVWRK